MLILLSDGASLASRQCATVLSRAGHQVEALSAEDAQLGIAWAIETLVARLRQDNQAASQPPAPSEGEDVT